MQMRRGAPLAVLLAALKDPDADLRQLAARHFRTPRTSRPWRLIAACRTGRPTCGSPALAGQPEGSPGGQPHRRPEGSQYRRPPRRHPGALELRAGRSTARSSRNGERSRRGPPARRPDTIGNLPTPSVPVIASLLSDPDPTSASRRDASAARRRRGNSELTTALKIRSRRAKHAPGVGERNER
jgi:hypothetical protein